jgi:RNA polymerase sigma factor (sigma-70 family)
LGAAAVIDDVDAQIVGLYKQWSRHLVGYAALLTGGDLPDAEGLVDEAFHQLHQNWARAGSFNDKGRYGWLRTVIRNKAVDAFRKRDRLPIPIDPLEDAAQLDQPSAHDNPDDPVHNLLTREHALLARELLDRCMAVIHSMPERRRIAILLRADGQSSRQIGALMGVDSSTVRGYWKQAIKELTASVGDVIKILDAVDEQDQDGEEQTA